MAEQAREKAEEAEEAEEAATQAMKRAWAVRDWARAAAQVIGEAQDARVRAIGEAAAQAVTPAWAAYLEKLLRSQARADLAGPGISR